MVSMARPFLADPDFVAKAAAGRADEIAPCIACNQACLDHTFAGKISSCLVNPRACHETELVLRARGDGPSASPLSAPGRRACRRAWRRPERGHAVTLFDRADRVGGQLNMAAAGAGQGGIPRACRLVRDDGREGRRRVAAGVEARAGGCAGLRRGDRRHRRDAARPGHPDGQDAPNVLSYIDVLLRGAEVGARVAVIGAGGIGFDVAEFLTHAAKARRRTSRSLAGGMGRGRPGGRGGWRRMAAARPAPSPRASCCCSARRRRWARGWARPPAGSTARA